jgi:DNA-binding NarL/FixJ family response regulator
MTTMNSVVLLDLAQARTHGGVAPSVTSLVESGRRVVVVAETASHDELVAALDAGASAVVRRTDVADPAVEAIAALLGEHPGPRSSTEDQVARREAQARLAMLSVRQREVLVALARGCTASEIAAAEHRSLATIRSHIHSILTALGLRSQIAAVALAHRAGWLEGGR